MSVRLGISVLDLLPQTSSLALQVPDDVVEKIGVLTILDHRATTSADFVLHEGTLQSAADTLGIDTSSWALQIPGLTEGLPFRLAIQRGTVTAGQEAAPTLWTLDIEVSDVEVQIPGVRAAKQTGGTGVTALTLQPVQGSEQARKVFLVARGVIRISGGGASGTQVQIVDTPDPLDPGAPTGAVIRLTARPPHFLFGDSRFGMTLDQFVLDLSNTYTPPEIVARSHDETWEGVSFREATFYLPPDTPLFHSLSVSARDVIVGSPGGLQGILQIQFGEVFADQFNTRITVSQQDAHGGSDTPVAQNAVTPPGTNLVFPVTAGTGGTTQRVRATFNIGIGQTIPGHSDIAVVGVYWKLPDGREGNDAVTPYFDAPTDAQMHYRLRTADPSQPLATANPPSAVPDGQTELTEVTVSFPRAAGSPTGAGPVVDATISGTVYNNVLHLRGPRTSLAGVQIATHANTHATWQLGTGSAPTVVHDAAGFTVPLLPEGTSSLDLTVTDDNGVRRVRIDPVAQGSLVVGHMTGGGPSAAVTVIGTGDASPTDVTDTFLAVPFHASAARQAASQPASFAGTVITVPQGTDAEVSIQVPANPADPLPTITPPGNTTPNVAQVLYNWDEADPQSVVYPFDGSASGSDTLNHEPEAIPLGGGDLSSRSRPNGTDVVSQLRQWLADFGPANGRKYYVVGRTDDLKFNGTLDENNTYNDGLADKRAAAASTALQQAGADPSRITVRHERAAFPTTPEGSPPTRITEAARLALPASQVTGTAPVWNKRWNADGSDTSTHASAKNDTRRPPYRSAEIYVVDTGGAPPPPPPPAPGGVPVRILVPGPDGAPPATVATTTNSGPPTDYRVQLTVKWDSPTVVSLSDAIPSEAEALIAWKKAQVELPATTSGNPPPVPPPTGPDYWQLLLHWAYDSRTGETDASGALSLPSGTMTFQSNPLAGALAFAPAFAAKLAPADTVSDAAGEFAAAAALFAVGAAIGALINSGAQTSSVDINGFSIEYKWDGAAHGKAAMDYTVDLRVNVSLSGAGSVVGHLKLRYKGVGVRFDGKPDGGFAGVAFSFDGLSVEVVDPGQWSLGGPLGNLIRIANSRMGNGSQWMEFDLQFALDLGVVTLEGATIRLAFDPFSAELRGLTASVNIPDTLIGRGSLTVGDGGSVRALLSLSVIPAKLSAYGAIAIDQDFVSIEVGVQLPVGIPLANTGFGIFGFMGRFVANGTRNLDGLNNPDPVQKQLDWYDRSPQDKYKRLSGQFAFGVGAVIGTLPDGAFTFNAAGSLTIGFPDISVVFGIDAHLISQRQDQATEQGTPNNASLRILGMVLIDETAITLAVRANFEIPHVLKLVIPISAYFPISGGDPWYIRIGTDNDTSRPGSPVSATLLPGILDVTAWAFIMIEERGLHNLGGTVVQLDLAQPLDFDGFTIGSGAGFDLKWSAGPFKLEISAYLLVGVGTKPLLFAGAAGVKGELDLVIISVGVDGQVSFHIGPDKKYLDGHFCGHVDFFFFSISGCVDIHIGDDPGGSIAPPDSPIAGIDLCDHLAAVKGKVTNSVVSPLPTVWPDTVAVVRFQHYINDNLGSSSDFNRKLASPAPLSPWSGTTALKYAFQLKSLTLFKLTGGDPSQAGSWTQVHGPFDSAWWLPTHRAAVIEGPPAPGPSTEEGRELGLFSTDPRAWSRWLGDGSQTQPGDPANTVGNVCDPSAPADPSCAYGKDWVFFAGTLGAFKASPPANAAFPSRFTVTADLGNGLDSATAAAFGNDAGWTWQPGAIGSLHGPAVVDGATFTSGWRFPCWTAMGHFVASAPMVLTFSKPLLSADVVLEICVNRDAIQLPKHVCDAMPDKTGPIDSFAGASGAKYTGRGMEGVTVGGVHALHLGAGLLIATYPGSVTEVTIDLDPSGDSIELVATGAGGAQVASATASGSGRRVVVLDGTGISGLTVKGGSKTIVFEVCWGPQPPAIAQYLDGVPAQTPTVTAIDVSGTAVVIQPQLAATPTTQPAAASVVVQTCPKITFKLPAGKGWTSIRIPPWLRGTVTLVAVCGVTMEASAAQNADSNFRASLKALLLGLAADVSADTPTHDVYLDANSTYELRVTWQWQGWQPAHPGDEPGPPDPNHWTDGPEERFRFATADFGLATTPAPVQNTSLDVDPAQGGPGYDERTFDPRGIARYLTAVTPTQLDAPHFLDDAIGFWFMVDHLETLIEKYDRILQVKVLRTRPPAGSLYNAPVHVSGSKHILDVTTKVSWQVTTDAWTQADYRFIQAAVAASCIGQAPSVGSSMVSVTADLVPRSEYDLLLNAAPKTVGGHPEVAIARSHFRTSRYHNPAGLLAGLGFAAPIAITMPTDAIATAAFPAGALQVGDTALDAALTALGLDPWPLPAAPRTTVVWLRPAAAGQPWRIAGVLIEADEPVWRPGFSNGAQGTPPPPPRMEVMSMTISRTYEQTIVHPGPGGHPIVTHVTKHDPLGTLAEVVRSGGGTRSLLVPAAPIAMTGGRIYDVALQLRENGSPGTQGSAPLIDRPLMIAQEGE
ncbi:MAG TPA: hypothetical protein VHB27_03860 [Rhodopila sp.]|uniref:hypothetical protein n=1 Tax=Rhodopila sp. TaxID=2480087 RepID=UPI002C0D847B|nr:hypothetical protein [Rhodopila sp.]HVY14338.1 hypothetical protein [Rhodopila sp.]